MTKIWFVVLAMPFTASAQKYNAALIADSLTKNANVVKRYDEIRVEIKEAGKAKLYEKHAYTILNEAGDRYAAYYSHYDKFDDINYIEGALYDATGKELKKVKKKDVEDLSGTEESLMTDTRYKAHNFYYRSYPYTVEYEEDDDLNGILDLPDWYPQGRNIMSVEYSKFVIVTPKNLDIRYKQFNFSGQPVITEKDDKKTYTWEIKNIPVRTSESYQPSWREILPMVMIAPADFEIQGYKGNMSSWENFGMFINTLLQGRDALPEAVKQKVHELTDNIKDPREKVKVLYSFLQQNTRYISIQLGIGGWQPFDANYVVTKRYGDCKALSNYMVALLKEAGIKANYVLIKAGDDEEDIVTDFPSNQFNHATVCVPLSKDTMWLECTSQTIAAGYISDFTGNRHAILIDEKGGHIVSTIKYRTEDNKQIRNISAVVDETGKLTASVKTHYTCLQQDKYHGMINHLSKDKILEELKKNIDLPDYDLLQFNYNETKSEKPYIDEQLQLVANNYASVSGKRLFVMPNVLSKNRIKLTALEQRKYDIDYSSSFMDIDTINIQMPSGYNIEAMPKDVTINNKFGNYEIHFKIDDQKINCTRLYKRSEGRFPPSDYAELVKFYDDMYKADRSRIVFIKKEG